MFFTPIMRYITLFNTALLSVYILIFHFAFPPPPCPLHAATVVAHHTFCWSAQFLLPLLSRAANELVPFGKKCAIFNDLSAFFHMGLALPSL